MKHPAKVMVWGAFGPLGVSELHVVGNNVKVNKEYYQEEILTKFALPAMKKRQTTGSILQRKMVPFPSRAIFMQDGATPHTAKTSQAWCENHLPGFWKKVEWPGNSPDLNPIENLWGIMKERVNSLPPCGNRESLIQTVKSVWSELSPDILANLVSGMPKRMKEVVRMKGDIIKI